MCGGWQNGVTASIQLNAHAPHFQTTPFEVSVCHPSSRFAASDLRNCSQSLTLQGRCCAPCLCARTCWAAAGVRSSCPPRRSCCSSTACRLGSRCRCRRRRPCRRARGAAGLKTLNPGPRRHPRPRAAWASWRRSGPRGSAAQTLTLAQGSTLSPAVRRARQLARMAAGSWGPRRRSPRLRGHTRCSPSASRRARMHKKIFTKRKKSSLRLRDMQIHAARAS